MTRLGRSLALLVVVASACTVDVPPPPTAPPATSLPTTTTTAPTTTTTEGPEITSPPAEGAACVMGDVPFAEDGVVAAFGTERGDAAAIAGFRWSAEAECERFVVDLATVGGSPAATLGRTSVELRPTSGLVRISLPDEVRTTSVADSVMDTPIARHAYVVRQSDGRLVVDLHLDAPTGVLARAFAVGSPARIVVDLMPATDAPPVRPPDAGEDIVLLAPPPGPAEYPLRVSGYARMVEAEVLVVLGPETPGNVEQTATAADSSEAWGAFSVTIGSGPTGTVEVFVSGGSTATGAPVGLSVLRDIR